MLEQLRQWLILLRAHTAILEAPMAVLGAAYGIGSFNDPILLGWLLFGCLYHYSGYSMNSYVDWKKGFDKNDPRKQHHPLNKGTINPDTAKKVVFLLLGLLIILGFILGGPNLITLGCILVMLVSGVSYNYFGKITWLKFLPISITHTMVFVFPYLVYSTEITAPFVLITSAYFIHHVFQIAISGDVKDIDQDEASLIQKLGATVGKGIVYEDRFDPGDTLLLLVPSLSILQITLASSAAVLIDEEILSFPFIILFGIITLYYSERIVLTGTFNRGERVKHMSIREIAGYAMIHSTMIVTTDLTGFLAILSFMVVYLVVTNKFIWGNLLKPDV